MRKILILGTALLLTGCTAEDRYFKQSLWPFGNPNAPVASSETAQRALGKAPKVAVIEPQPGNIWPGPVQPMPTLSQVEQNANLPLGRGYTPSVPSPYPPGQTAPTFGLNADDLSGSLYPSSNGQEVVPPPVPGDQR